MPWITKVTERREWESKCDAEDYLDVITTLSDDVRRFVLTSCTLASEGEAMSDGGSGLGADSGIDKET